MYLTGVGIGGWKMWTGEGEGGRTPGGESRVGEDTGGVAQC